MTDDTRLREPGALDQPDSVDDGLAVAEDLAEVSQILVAAEGVDATVALVCRLAVEHVPGCEGASVLLLSRRHIRSMGATNEAAARFDELQLECSEGPCMDALQTEDVVRVDDLLADLRWPALRQAPATGVRSVLAHGLRSASRTMGALNLYSSVPFGFDDNSTTSHLGALFARHAAVALAGAKALDELHAALETRETISVAMGILMARESITRSQAFDVLRRASQRENVRVSEIAARIAGELEGAQPR